MRRISREKALNDAMRRAWEEMNAEVGRDFMKWSLAPTWKGPPR